MAAAAATAGDERRSPPPRAGQALLVAQVGLFGALEAAEHLHAGHDVHGLAAEPSFRWGVGAQLVSAGLLLLATRLARASGTAVRTRLARRRVAAPRKSAV